MPRVKLVTAAKDYPHFGIKKGQKHYHWKVKTGPVSGREYRQIDPPKPSQLTMSAFQGAIGDLELEFDQLEHNDGLPEALREIAERVREIGQEEQDKFDNMPENFQYGSTGEMLQERASGCEEWADAIEQAASDLETKIEEINAKEVHELEEFEGDDPDEEGYEAPTEEQVEEAREAEISAACDEALSEASGAKNF